MRAGDYVLLRAAPSVRSLETGLEASARLRPRTSARVYQVHKMPSPHNAILRDPVTLSTDLGFSQPVAIERLVPYEVSELIDPVPTDETVAVEVRLRDGSWKNGRVTHQSPFGHVRISFTDGTTEDLSLEDHEHRFSDIVPRAQNLVFTEQDQVVVFPDRVEVRHERPRHHLQTPPLVQGITVTENRTTRVRPIRSEPYIRSDTWTQSGEKHLSEAWTGTTTFWRTCPDSGTSSIADCT